MAQKKRKGKNGQTDGGRAPEGPEREKQLEDAMHEIDSHVANALNPLSVLRRLFDSQEDLKFDFPTLREMSDLVERAYENVNGIFNTVTHTI